MEYRYICLDCNRIYSPRFVDGNCCPHCNGGLYKLIPLIGPAFKADKPPLGLMPATLFYEERINQIIEAMNRYLQADKPIPIEWVKEYNTIAEAQSKMVLPEYPEVEHVHETFGSR